MKTVGVIVLGGLCVRVGVVEWAWHISMQTCAAQEYLDSACHPSIVGPKPSIVALIVSEILKSQKPNSASFRDLSEMKGRHRFRRFVGLKMVVETC